MDLVSPDPWILRFSKIYYAFLISDRNIRLLSNVLAVFTLYRSNLKSLVLINPDP